MEKNSEPLREGRPFIFHPNTRACFLIIWNPIMFLQVEQILLECEEYIASQITTLLIT